MRGTSVPARSRKKVGRIPTIAMLIGAALIAHSALAQDDRERPWPDEWPIVLPPIRGPLPDEPPRGPTISPVTRAGERALREIGEIQQNVRDTRYQHHLAVNPRNGTYRWDCSLMVKWILQRAAPTTVRDMGESRALAEHFVRLIERAPQEGFRRGWQRLDDIRTVRPGDVFAWRRPRGFPSNNTGHVGFVVGPPRAVEGIPNAFAILVADATRSAHQNDTRPWPGEGGFGIGTLVFLTDGQGHGTHYGWAGTLSGGYVVTPILFGRIGP